MRTNKSFQQLVALWIGVPLLCAGPSTRASDTVAPLSPHASAPPARSVSVFGFVHLPNGSPAVGQLVTATRTPGSHVAGVKEPWALVNDNGAFALNRGLPAPGKCILHVAGAPVKLLMTVGRRPYTVLYLKMSAGTVRASSPFAAPAPHRTVIFGVVTRPDGRTPLSPTTSASVTISRGAQVTKKVEESASVGDSGAFVLPDALSPGIYTVVATGNGSTVARARLVVPRPRLPYMVLIVKAASGSMCGRVLDPAGRPFVNGTVVLINEPRNLVYNTTTGKNGRYAIKHVLPGQYIAAVGSPRPADPADLEEMMETVVIRNGQLKKDFTVSRVLAASSKRPRTVPVVKAVHGSIYGRILDAAEHPVVGGVVTLLGTPQPQGLVYNATAGKGGYYVIKHVVPGQYIAQASSNPVYTDLANREAMTEIVVIKNGQLEKDFTLRKVIPPGNRLSPKNPEKYKK